MYYRLGILLAIFVLAGCSRDSMTRLGNKDDACYPGKSGRHIVEMDRIRVNEKDFHTTTSGDPLRIRIYLLEDDNELDAEGGGALVGTRGERTIDPPLRWDVDFKRDSRYQIVVEEEGDNNPDAGHWVFPDTPRPGFWPVPANNFTFRFGGKSSIHFSEEVTTAEE